MKTKEGRKDGLFASSALVGLGSESGLCFHLVSQEAHFTSLLLCFWNIRVSNKSQICVYIPTSLTNAGCMVLSEPRRTFTSETPNSVDTKELAVVLLCCTFIKI